MSHVLVYSDRGGIFGAEQWAHRVSLGLMEAGHRVTVAQPRAEHHLVEEREAHGITHLWLEEDNLYDVTRRARALDDFAEPARVFERTDPDLILFCDSCPLSNLAAKEIARKRRTPYLCVVHCVTETWAESFKDDLKRLGPVYAGAEQVVAVSQDNLELLRRCFSLPPGRGRVIHNGCPDAFFSPRSPQVRGRVRRELNIPLQATVCLSIGRFEFVKGYQYQLSAMHWLRQCPAWADLFFVWIGTGTLEARLRSMLRLLRIEGKVRFLRDRFDIPELMDAADLFVLPSQFEGMPLVVLEAMARGLPVVATAVSGTPEALDDCGLLLPDPREDPAMPEKLAGAICNLSMDAAHRQALGDSARKRAGRYFHEQQMVRRYLELIAGVLTG